MKLRTLNLNIVVTNSTCLRTVDGATNQFSGSAIVQFAEFNEVQSYRWMDGSGREVSTDARLIDTHPGTWSVVFTAQNGCEHSASFEIETSLEVYNGISANDDGKKRFLPNRLYRLFP